MDWVQLDAPRHHYLLTEHSLALLSLEEGLEIRDVWHDSLSSQFWASERYRRDVPLMAEGPPAAGDDLRAQEELAERLNRIHLGDQAVFILGHCP